MRKVVISIRPAAESDREAILALSDRLAAFGPTTRTSPEVTQRERKALAEALSQPSPSTPLLVAELEPLGLVGILLLDRRIDYFTDEAHGHVAILAVSSEAEGKGVGRALLQAAEDWGRAEGFKRITLNVFTDNRRAKAFYERQGWRSELESYYKALTT